LYVMSNLPLSVSWIWSPCALSTDSPVDRLEVAGHLLSQLATVERRRRVVQRHDGYRPVGGGAGEGFAVQVADLAATLGRVEEIQQEVHREAPQRADHNGPDQLDLLDEKRRVQRDLFGARVAVAGRAVLHDVGDVYVLAL